MWKFKSPVGDILIMKENGKYALVYENITYETNSSPEAIADNVYQQATGIGAWDSANTRGVKVPTDLCDWIES